MARVTKISVLADLKLSRGFNSGGIHYGASIVLETPEEQRNWKEHLKFYDQELSTLIERRMLPNRPLIKSSL